MENKKIYIVGQPSYMEYGNWIRATGFENTNDLEQADLVLFAGGADLSASVYGQTATRYLYEDHIRDREENPIFEYCVKQNKAIIGICLGSQRVCALNNGKIVQHMRHTGEHPIKTFDNHDIIVTSSHHNQMIVDNKITGLIEQKDYVLIGWAEKLSPFHIGEFEKDYCFEEDYKEPEIVYFPKTNSLAIQSHPEWCFPTSTKEELKYIEYCQNLIQKFLFA